MSQILIDRATLEQSLETLQRLPFTNLDVDSSIDSLTAALAKAETKLQMIATTEPAKIERKIYKDTPEYRSYLDARFTPGKLGVSFELDGHRWAYHWTSFDDAGDFDLIYRWVEPKHSPMPGQDVEDAARYRWLREQTWTMGGLVVTDVANVRLGAMCPADSLLDQTIDAAIAKGAK